MKGWRCETSTGVDDRQSVEMQVPDPAPGEVRVAVGAASLNFPDLLIVEGKHQVRPSLPFVAGAEFAGVVDAVGEGAIGWTVGDRVMTVGTHGSFATHACVLATRLKPCPLGMPIEAAAAFLMLSKTGTWHQK